MFDRSRADGHEPDDLGGEDQQLAACLQDALAGPPLPNSLLRRLDGMVADAWGGSPGLVPGRRTRGRRSAGRRALTSRRWLAVAAMALSLLLVVVLRPGRQAYGWSAVLRALSGQATVMVPGEGGAWLAVPERAVALVDGEVGAEWIDFRRGRVLRRTGDQPPIEQRSFPPGEQSPQFERAVLHWMIGAASRHRPLVPAEWRVAAERWVGSGQTPRELHLEVEGGQQPVRIQLTVDPRTHLPLTFRIVGDVGDGQRRSVAYAESDLASWQAERFPAGWPVVDAGSALLAGPPEAEVVAGAPAGRDVAGAARAVAADETVAAATDQPAGGGEAEASLAKGAAGLDWQPLANPGLVSTALLRELDQRLARRWAAEDVVPVTRASGGELLRRVYLDLVGRTPSVSEARAFLASEDPGRYEQLVDRLLASPDHATHLATVWRTFLLPEGVDLSDFGGTADFDRWLADRFARNLPYDQLVRQLLSAEGRLARSGPLAFYAAAKLDPDQLAARTSRAFLGMRLECAQCHDDPFEPWTQRDFWSYAAFFARISRPQAKLDAASRVMQVRDVDRGEVMLPETDLVVAPLFLDGRRPAADQEEARRQQLSRWLTSPENPYFARATVNRVWSQLFGRGIVDPVDGFGGVHQPVAPEVLDLLAGHFAHHGFDLRELIATVVRSRAYQLSSADPPSADASRADAEPADDPSTARRRVFAQMSVKMLSAEQLYDCISVATMLGPTQDDLSLRRSGNTAREAFLAQFRTPGGISTDYQGGIPQALTLMNGTLIQSATDIRSSGLLESLRAPFFTDAQRLEVIYLSTLSRKPTSRETVLLRDYLQDAIAGSGEDAIYLQLADVLWAVLNSAEFTMNH